MEDNMSTKLCTECYTLIQGLLEFNERVDKVQTMYCLLQNMGFITEEQTIDVRKQCGLVEENCHQIIGKHKLSQSQLLDLLQEDVHHDSVSQEVIYITKSEDINQQAETNEVEAIKGFLTDDQEFIIMEDDTEQDDTYFYELNDIEEQRNEYNSSSSVSGKQKNNLVMEREGVTIVEELEIKRELNGSNCNRETESDLEDELSMKNLDYKLDKRDNIIDQRSSPSSYRTRYSLRRRQTDDISSKEYSKRAKLDEQVNSNEVNVCSSQSPLLNENVNEGVTIVDDETLNGTEEQVVSNDGDNYIIINSNSSDDLVLPLKPKGRPNNSVRGCETKARYECQECKRKYKNPNVYRKHMETMHNVFIESLPDYMCTICNKDYFTESRLKVHMRAHLPEKDRLTVPCPYCDRKFSQRCSMRQHINGFHRQMRPYICDQCGRRCKTMAALNEHQLVHTNECPFECEICHRRFKNKPRLKSHLETHTGSTHICPVCGLQLNTRRTLRAHLLVHSDEKRFKCQFCDAAFKRSKAFKNHLILHTGMRPYKCNFCGKAFSNGSNCRAHKRKCHPKELAEEEASGRKASPVPVPKLEDLKSV